MWSLQKALKIRVTTCCPYPLYKTLYLQLIDFKIDLDIAGYMFHFLTT